MRLLNFDKSWWGSLKSFLILVLGSVVLSGCGATLNNVVAVSSAGNYGFSSQIVFSGSVANVLEQNPGLVNNLVSTIKARGGEITDKSAVSGGVPRVTIGFSLQTTDILKTSLITSIRAIDVTSSKGDLTAIIKTVRPTQLIRAITNAAINQRYSSSIAATMLESTTIVNRINFPNGVLKASAGGVVSGNEVSFSRALNQINGGQEEASAGSGGNRFVLFVEIGVGVFLILVALKKLLSSSFVRRR